MLTSLVACRATREEKLAALRTTLAQTRTAADSLAEEQKKLLKNMKNNQETLNSLLRDAKNKYYQELAKYAKEFENAIEQVTVGCRSIDPLRTHYRATKCTGPTAQMQVEA